MAERRNEGLTVAVTGPTGAIGKALVRLLEKTSRIERIIGMARRPFDPEELGWKKTEYRRGDILDADAVADLVAEADAVVHLAFIIMGAEDEARNVNLQGSRNVFEATMRAKVPRLIYTSSVAAYGFHDDNPDVL
ncbi:MAG: NAD-dependent epimerase/dehydratase family protein, partial [Actinomycetota bacterium]